MTKLETPVAQVTGLVKGYKSNKHGDIDAIEIDTEKGPVSLHFPPHVAKSVTETIAIGQQVTADYVDKAKPEKKPKSELKTIQTDKQNDALVIEDNKPKKPSGTEHIETLKPEKFTLVRDKKDELVGIQFDDKLIHLHKEDKEIAEAIRPDSVLTIQAVLRSDEGFVNEHKLAVYHIKGIDIDGRSFDGRSFQPSKK